MFYFKLHKLICPKGKFHETKVYFLFIFLKIYLQLSLYSRNWRKRGKGTLSVLIKDIVSYNNNSFFLTFRHYSHLSKLIVKV